MFRTIDRSQNSQRSHDTESVNQQPRTKLAAFKQAMRNLASNLMCRNNNVVVSSHINNLPLLNSDTVSHLLTFLEKSEKETATTISKDLRRAVREKQLSLNVPGDQFAHALSVYPNVRTIKITGQLSFDDINSVSVQQQMLSLDLYFCGQGLTDTVLVELVGKFPNLTSLNLARCQQLTDLAVVALAENCPNLTSLNLNHCLELTDSAVVALAENCPNLISLSARDLALTDSAVLTLAKNCPNLSFLNLSDCEDLTILAFNELAAKCKELTSLRLDGNELITDADVMSLVENCSKLSYLSLFDCINITDRTLTELAENYPKLYVDHHQRQGGRVIS